MHLLLRELRLSTIASVAGSLIYAFTGYAPTQASGQPNIYASLVWLPLVFYFHRKATKAKGWSGISYACLGGMAGAVQIAAGHLQPFIHTSYGVCLFALVESLPGRDRVWSVRPLFLAVGGQALAVAFAAVPVGLSHEYLQLVYRWFDGGVSKYPHSVALQSWRDTAGLRWSDFATVFQPTERIQEYGATLYFTLAGFVAAMAALWKPRRVVLAFLAVAVFALAVALSHEIGLLAFISFRLPLLAQTRTPVRVLYLFSFAAAAIAAFGIDRLAALARDRSPLAGRIVGITALCLIVVETANFANTLGDPAGGPQYPPTYYEKNAALDAIEKLSNAGPRVDRYLAKPFDLLPPNAGDVRPVLDVMGHRATMQVNLNDYFALDWDLAKSVELDRLGVRWIITNESIAGLPPIARVGDDTIYERPKALSVFWTLDPATGERVRAPVKKVEWSVNHVALDVAPVDKRLLFVFAQPHYPGWGIYVDGKVTAPIPVEIFDAVYLSLPARISCSIATNRVCGPI
jgi:hypothetical protein